MPPASSFPAMVGPDLPEPMKLPSNQWPAFRTSHFCRCRTCHNTRRRRQAIPLGEAMKSFPFSLVMTIRCRTVNQRATPAHQIDRVLAGGAGEMLCSLTSVSQGTRGDSGPHYQCLAQCRSRQEELTLQRQLTTGWPPAIAACAILSHDR